MAVLLAAIISFPPMSCPQPDGGGLQNRLEAAFSSSRTHAVSLRVRIAVLILDCPHNAVSLVLYLITGSRSLSPHRENRCGRKSSWLRSSLPRSTSVSPELSDEAIQEILNADVSRFHTRHNTHTKLTSSKRTLLNNFPSQRLPSRWCISLHPFPQPYISHRLSSHIQMIRVSWIRATHLPNVTTTRVNGQMLFNLLPFTWTLNNNNGKITIPQAGLHTMIHSTSLSLFLFLFGLQWYNGVNVSMIFLVCVFSRYPASSIYRIFTLFMSYWNPTSVRHF